MLFGAVGAVGGGEAVAVGGLVEAGEEECTGPVRNPVSK